jgi:hypothetical protein
VLPSSLLLRSKADIQRNFRTISRYRFSRYKRSAISARRYKSRNACACAARANRDCGCYISQQRSARRFLEELPESSARSAIVFPTEHARADYSVREKDRLDFVESSVLSAMDAYITAALP